MTTLARSIADRLKPLEEMRFKISTQPDRVTMAGQNRADRWIGVRWSGDTLSRSDFSQQRLDINSEATLDIKFRGATDEQLWALRSILYSLLLNFEPDGYLPVSITSFSDGELEEPDTWNYTITLQAQAVYFEPLDNESLVLLRSIFFSQEIINDINAGSYELLPQEYLND